MPTCCHCNAVFEQYKNLAVHLRKVHITESYITCMECFRSYHNVNSFRHHYMNTKHNLPVLSANQENCTNSIINDENFEVLNSFSSSASIESSNNIINDQNLETQNSSPSDIRHVENLNNQNSDFNTMKILAKLHSYGDVPRSRIIEIVSDFSEFFKEKIDEIIDSLKKFNSHSDQVEKILREKSEPFKNLSTEYKQFKRFQNDAYYVPPQQIFLGTRNDYRKSLKNKKLKIPAKVKCTAEFIQIRLILKYFFELPGYFRQILDFVNSLNLEKTLIRNFIQGAFWQNKKKTFDDAGKIVFPIFIYFDDFENNNPLGSHAGLSKCGAVYFSLPFLPNNLRSKITNVFLFVLFNSLDRKLFKNKVIFRKVIDELKFLESEGILVNFEGNEIRIFFQLALILGDNLGLHSLFGFSESFRTSYPCRFCLIHFDNISNHFSDDNISLRDEVNYLQHVDNIKYGDLSRSCNVVEKCIFHELRNGFHITRNLCVDVMHDIFEGVAQYDLGRILNFYVNESKLFTLEQLNERISAYLYKDWENRPTEIQMHHLRRKVLKMSASEMMTFIRNFPFLIGDLIPEDDDCWNLFIAFKKAVDIIMLNIYNTDTHKLMKIAISEYLEILNTLFPQCLKPKHHNLTHYWRVAYLMGPLWHLSSMRFESRHHEGKKISRSAICRANVCHTIAIKTQLQLNNRFLLKYPLPGIFTYGPFIEVRTDSLNFRFEDLPNCPANYRDIESISSPKWVARYGKKIKNDDIYIEFRDDSVDPYFFSIKCIIFDPTKGLMMIVKNIEKFIFFDHHFQNFCLLPDYASSQPLEWKILYECDVINSSFSSTFSFDENKEYVIVSSF